MSFPPNLTAERLRELLHYDPETGVFTWRVNRRGTARAGSVAGCIHAVSGNVVINVAGNVSTAQRLAWLYMTGAWPSTVLIHKDGDKVNNRFANIREVTPFPPLTAERLRDVLCYDPDTGVFTTRVCRGNAIPGMVVGTRRKGGYIVIGVDDRLYLAHRLAWLYVIGSWPALALDHIDGNTSNNRFSNLREATQGENAQNKRAALSNNRSSGLLGVTWDAAREKWKAAIGVAGRTRFIGRYDTPEAAHTAYLDAKRELHPFNTL
jgi:hypothetical protein